MANGLLMQLGVINEPILWLTDPRYDLGIVIVVQLWLSLGTSFLAFIAGLQGVDRSLYEAGACLLYTSPLEPQEQVLGGRGDLVGIEVRQAGGVLVGPIQGHFAHGEILSLIHI